MQPPVSAGESFYPESFAVLVGSHTVEGVSIEKTAQLTLQDDNLHDKYAVRVTIDGYPVGHLSREHARAFRRTVRYGQLADHETFEWLRTHLRWLEPRRG